MKKKTRLHLDPDRELTLRIYWNLSEPGTHQYPKEPNRAHQNPTEPIRGHQSTQLNPSETPQNPSEPLKTQQNPSAPIRAHQHPSEPVGTHQNLSEPTIRTHQNPSEPMRIFGNLRGGAYVVIWDPYRVSTRRPYAAHTEGLTWDSCGPHMRAHMGAYMEHLGAVAESDRESERDGWAIRENP